MGKDMDHPPVASPTMADQVAPLLDALQELFNAPWDAFVHLGPTIRQEQDPTSYKFMSHS